MNYHDLFADQDIALLSDWLAAIGELYVDMDYPHSGGSGLGYRVRSMSDLKLLVAEHQNRAEVVFTIFQNLQFSLRGTAGDALLARALEAIPDGEWFTIIMLADVYPVRCGSYGSGNTHEEMRQEFADLAGELVGVGQHPFDLSDTLRWIRSGPEFSISVAPKWVRKSIPREAYDKDPARYRDIIDLWRR